jgi:hypothetical protein
VLRVVLLQAERVLLPHVIGEGVAGVLHPLPAHCACVLAAVGRLSLQELLEVGGGHLMAGGDVGGQECERTAAQLLAAQLAAAGRPASPTLSYLPFRFRV